MLASARRHLRLAGLEHEDPEDVWRDAQLKILDQLSAGRRLIAEPGDTQQDAYLRYGHAVLKLHVNDLRKKAIRRRTDTHRHARRARRRGGRLAAGGAQHGPPRLAPGAARPLRADAQGSGDDRARLHEAGDRRGAWGLDQARRQAPGAGKAAARARPRLPRRHAAAGDLRRARHPAPAACGRHRDDREARRDRRDRRRPHHRGRRRRRRGDRRLEHHEKQPVAAAEQGQRPTAPPHTAPTTSAAQPTHTTVAPPRQATTTTTSTRPRTTAARPRRTRARARSRDAGPDDDRRPLHDPADLPGGDHAHARPPDDVDADRRPSRTHAPATHAAAAPANLCVQQGLCR